MLVQDENFSWSGAEQADQDLDQYGFPCTGFSQYHEVLPFVQMQVYTFEHMVVAKRLIQSFDLYYFFRG